jgi:putative addiction module CopG family antidote
MGERTGLASVNLGKTKEIALRLVAEGRYENVSEACRAGLRRLERDIDRDLRLVAILDQAMASGIDDAFDADAFVAAINPPT